MKAFRGQVVRSVREFLTESYKERMEVGAVGQEMAYAVCYVATVPQQKSSSDSGLFLADYVGTLLKGNEFTDDNPDVRFSFSFLCLQMQIKMFTDGEIEKRLLDRFPEEGGSVPKTNSAATHGD